MNRSPQHPALSRLEQIDWDSPASILDGCVPLFKAAGDEADLLLGLLDRLADDPELASMCERYDFLDKLVLADLAAAQVRVRLHVYRPGYFDRPHNHRWNFASNIIRGQYRHLIFGRDDTFNEQTDPDALVPIHERIEQPGDHYVLHHSSVHTVRAEADTVSLLVRGPATKERFLIIDRAAGGFFWVYGQANETAQQRAAKQMSASRLAESIGRARRLLHNGAGRSS